MEKIDKKTDREMNDLTTNVTNSETDFFADNATTTYFSSADFTLFHGDCVEIIRTLDISPSVVFADPPYFLSNGGQTIRAGQIVSVDKGDWDQLQGNQTVMEFNYQWISAVRNIMPANGTIFISGTSHNIHSVAMVLSELGFKIINEIVWEKTNPPPGFARNRLVDSFETIIWARKDEKTPHYFNYDLAKKLNGSKQMKNVWQFPAAAPWEKEHGKHPTQKPCSLLSRIILTASKPGDIILDPFCGSGTTGFVANLFDRKFVGIDLDAAYLDTSRNRKQALDANPNKCTYFAKIRGLELIIDYLNSPNTDLA